MYYQVRVSVPGWSHPDPRLGHKMVSWSRGGATWINMVQLWFCPHNFDIVWYILIPVSNQMSEMYSAVLLLGKLPAVQLLQLLDSRRSLLFWCEAHTGPSLRHDRNSVHVYSVIFCIILFMSLHDDLHDVFRWEFNIKSFMGLFTNMFQPLCHMHFVILCCLSIDSPVHLGEAQGPGSLRCFNAQVFLKAWCFEAEIERFWAGWIYKPCHHMHAFGLRWFTLIHCSLRMFMNVSFFMCGL